MTTEAHNNSDLPTNEDLVIDLQNPSHLKDLDRMTGHTLFQVRVKHGTNKVANAWISAHLHNGKVILSIADNEGTKPTKFTTKAKWQTIKDIEI
jgi:hypothetical protein